MNLFSFLKSAFSPIVNIIEKLDISGNEKQKLLNHVYDLNFKMQEKSIDLMKSENLSSSYLTANWRPICSILLVSTLVISDLFGLEVGQNTLELTKIFLSVYTGGRSLEKLATVFKK